MFQLEIPTGTSELHHPQTAIRMDVPTARGGDGKTHVNLALFRTGRIHWEKVDPPPKSGGMAQDRVAELKNGLDWSEPQLQPAGSKYAGRWASHATVKGVVKLAKVTPPTFVSREGDFQINTSSVLVFWPQGNYMPLSFRKSTRDLSQPIQEAASVPDGNQLPPYST